MKRTLCLDFGNTRLKAGVFEGADFLEEVVVPDGEAATMEELLEKYHPQNSILSSVVHHPAALENMLATYTSFHKLSHLTKLNFTTPVGKPATIGSDRLALAAAAVYFYPQKII